MAVFSFMPFSFMPWVLRRLAARLTGCSSETAQPGYDAPHKRARQTAGEIGDGGALADFGESRIRHHHTGEGPDVEALGDRQRPGRDQLARVRPDDGGAENPSVGGRDDLDVP